MKIKSAVKALIVFLLLGFSYYKAVTASRYAIFVPDEAFRQIGRHSLIKNDFCRWARNFKINRELALFILFLF